MPYTIYDKIWNEHLVHEQEDGTSLLFVDRHLIHEVTSPQAFEGLRNSKRKVRQPKLTLAVADHNVPTTDRSKGISDHESKIQVETLDTNCKEFGIEIFGMNFDTGLFTDIGICPLPHFFHFAIVCLPDAMLRL